METKTAVLGAYIPNDNLIGIGLSLDNIQSKNPINWTGQNLLGKALMDIREKFRMDMALITDGAITEGTIPESAIAQRVVSRRKPAVAAAVAAAVAQPVAQLEPVAQEEIVSVAEVQQPAGPRTIRRRPRPAPELAPQLASQQPISLGNIPININKQ